MSSARRFPGRAVLTLAAGLAVLAGAILAAPPAGADPRFVGTFDAVGHDVVLGAYEGVVDVSAGEGGALRVSGSLRFAAGFERAFSAEARVVDGVRLSFPVIEEDGSGQPVRLTVSFREDAAAPGALAGAWRLARAVRRRAEWVRRVEPVEPTDAAPAAGGDDPFVGAFTIQGKDTREGRYSGAVTLAAADDPGQRRVEGVVRFERDDGTERRSESFAATGQVREGRLSFAVELRGGLDGATDRLGGLLDPDAEPDRAGPVRFTASYRPDDDDGDVLVGAWRVDRRVRRRDTWTREGAASDADPESEPEPEPTPAPSERDPDAPPPELAIVEAFPELPRFRRPVLVTAAPGGDALVVVEQGGRVFLVEDRPGIERAELFIDLSNRVSFARGEQGLLGLAFHPSGDGRFVVGYTDVRDGSSVVARLESRDGRGDPGSLTELLRVEQPFRNHNGGHVAFGSDGMLYVGLGDGGAAGDPLGNAQNLQTLLGSILRIDIDRSSDDRPYAIPSDNPFRRRRSARPEVWAYGLRNPWRFSFDRATGELWAGDVGQDAHEEIDVIERGGNYGWRAREGFVPFDEEVAARGARDPVVSYPAEVGRAVIGGHVYRGAAIPWLEGRYVFTDFFAGVVWSVTRGGSVLPGEGWRGDGVAVHELVTDTGVRISSWGEDAAGELHATGFDGRIYELVEVATAEDEAPASGD